MAQVHASLCNYALRIKSASEPDLATVPQPMKRDRNFWLNHELRSGVGYFMAILRHLIGRTATSGLCRAMGHASPSIRRSSSMSMPAQRGRQTGCRHLLDVAGKPAHALLAAIAGSVSRSRTSFSASPTPCGLDFRSYFARLGIDRPF